MIVMATNAAFYNALEIENELAFQLSKETDLQHALEMCLLAAIEISEMDAGGVYLFNQQNQDLELIVHRGLGKSFIDKIQNYSESSEAVRAIRKGYPIHITYEDLPKEIGGHDDPLKEAEGLREISVIPISSNNEVIGCINVASHKKNKIKPFTKQLLEHLAPQIGLAIDRIQLQEAREQQQLQIKSLFNSFVDFIFIVGMDGKVLAVNETVNDRLGYSDDELIGKQFLLVHPPDLRQQAIYIFQEMVEGESILCPLEIMAKDGERIPVETKISIGLWDGQQAIIGISRDMTDHRKLETSKKEYLEFLDFLVKLSTDFIKAPVKNIDELINSILEKIGCFDLADRSYIFLFPDKDTLSNTHEWCAEDVTPEIDNLQDLPKSIFPWWFKKLENFEAIHLEDINDLPAEEVATREILESQGILSILVVPLINSDEELIGFMGFDSIKKHRNFSENSKYLVRLAADMVAKAIDRKEQDTKLRASEIKNAAIIQAFPDPLVFIDRKGKVTDFLYDGDNTLFVSFKNNAFSVDYLPNLFYQHTQTEIDGFLKSINSTIELDKPYRKEVNHINAKGQISWFEARVSKMDHDHAIMVLRDITFEKNFQQERIDFMNIASHELRSPVSTMKLMTELISFEPDDPEQLEFWEILKHELDRQYLLIENILSSNKLENGRYVFDFIEIPAQDAEKQTTVFLQTLTQAKKINLSISPLRIEVDGKKVKLDFAALTLALANLVDNAEKYNSNQPALKVDYTVQDNKFLIAVKDNGIGIDADDLPQIFTRYMRGKNTNSKEIKGTGLGLFITKSIIDQHNGSISVSSEREKGTTFTIAIPVIDN
jgi:PAS domain S-box-containing protein